jgi:Arc/MetJ-type ribon-helix-helix transcriptional regulator
VRAAAVYEIGPEDGEVLRALAREDADTRVRRAAVARLDEGNVLADIARTDPDEEVRSEAVRGLAGLAAEADDVSAATDAVRHLLALGRTKEVVVVARASTSKAVRSAIVDVLEDQKALGSLSRHAADNSTRLRALARVSDEDELLNIALKSEHTDAAVAALERINRAEALSAIAQRARNKVATRRARTKLRALEEPSQPPPAPESTSISAADRQRATDLVTRAEALVTLTDPDEASARLSEVRRAWAELQADVAADAVVEQQFESASDAVREAIAERQQERDAEQARAEALAREQADRIAICEEIENLSGEGTIDRIAELKVRWDNLPPMPSEYAASLTRRFQDACRAFADGERRRMLAQAAASRIDTLATELEQLIASSQPLDEIIARWRGLRRDAEVLREHLAANPDAGARLEQAVAALEQKEQEHQQLRAKQEQDNLKRLQQTARQVETLVAADLISLKAGDRALRDIKDAVESRAPLPSKKDRQELQARLEAARAQLGPRVQELREADEWQRWANLQVQEELCKEMEALKTEENLELSSRKMRELQSRWKQVALAPRAQGEAMWRRFKTAQDDVYARTSAHLVAQNEERAANLVAKQALCQRAEALADSTEWVKTAAEIQALQAEWKRIGPVSRGHEKAVWERFRAACDKFFTRRQEDLKHRKEEWGANLARKEALCEQAETLADSTEWDDTATQLKRLQAEWKTVGPVRKSKSEAVWQRFRAACDRFFDRYKHRDQVELQQKAAARDQIIRDLESLLPQTSNGSGPGSAPDDLYTKVQEARAKWQHAPEVPRQVQQDLAARYHQAIGQLVGAWPEAFAGTDLDPETTRKRMEKLLARIEDLLTGAQEQVQTRQLSPTELLAEKWRERLASNTIAGSRATQENEEVRWRNAEQEVRSAQSQWARLGPVPPEVAGPLNERFQRAVRRFYDSRRKAS